MQHNCDITGNGQATNGLMPVAEPGDHDAFIAYACSSDSVVTPWVLRVRHWVV